MFEATPGKLHKKQIVFVRL